MTQSSIIKTVTKTFGDLGLHVTEPPEDANLPFKGVIVEFGLDDEERPVMLQVLQYAQEVIAPQNGDKSEKTTATNLNILAFIMTIPIEVDEKNVNETLKLIALSNKALPLGSFNYSAVEKAIYYSYNLPLLVEAPSELILLTIIQTILFAKETFITVIEQVATGKETVATFLDLINESTTAK